MPDNEHLFNVDPNVAARYGIGGLAGGAALAAALNFVRRVRDINEDRKRKRMPDETDEGTIVLSLPKRAGDLSEGSVGDMSGGTNRDVTLKNRKIKVRKDSPILKDLEPLGAQLRHYDGRFGNTTQPNRGPGDGAGGGTKTASWQSLAVAMLAAGGAGALGYSLVDKLYEMQRRKELQGELDTAKTEYGDLLLKRQKTAEFEVMFDIFPHEKSAGKYPDTFHTMDVPMGMAALLFLLGAGGTSYMTKKVLDDSMAPDNPEQSNRDRRLQVKRIVFRAANEQDQEANKLAAAPMSEDDVDSLFKAALAIYLDIGSGKPTVLGSEKVATYLKAKGVTAGEIYKEAGDSYNNLMIRLQQDEELRKLLRDAAAESHPLLKWVPGGIRDFISPIRNRIDAGVTQGFQEGFGPGAHENRKQLKEVGNVLAQLKAQRSIDKYAGIGDSFLGNVFAGGALDVVNNVQEAKNLRERRRLEAQGEPDTDSREAEINSVLDDLQITAEDPQALKYIQDNRETIYNLLVDMANRGQLSKASAAVGQLARLSKVGAVAKPKLPPKVPGGAASPHMTPSLTPSKTVPALAAQPKLDAVEDEVTQPTTAETASDK
jgi:hypothetical protein